MFVPKYVFDQAWQEANFLISANNQVRIELRQQLEEWLHYGIMWKEENKKIRILLLARLDAIKVFDSMMFKLRRR